VTITKEFIEAGMCESGGWSREQLRLIGVSWPLVRGWKDRAVGREISHSDAEIFLALKCAHRKGYSEGEGK
jgi:hypothetical protein